MGSVLVVSRTVCTRMSQTAWAWPNSCASALTPNFWIQSPVRSFVSFFPAKPGITESTAFFASKRLPAYNLTAKRGFVKKVSRTQPKDTTSSDAAVKSTTKTTKCPSRQKTKEPAKRLKASGSVGGDSGKGKSTTVSQAGERKASGTRKTNPDQSTQGATNRKKLQTNKGTKATEKRKVEQVQAFRWPYIDIGAKWQWPTAKYWKSTMDSIWNTPLCFVGVSNKVREAVRFPPHSWVLLSDRGVEGSKSAIACAKETAAVPSGRFPFSYFWTKIRVLCKEGGLEHFEVYFPVFVFGVVLGYFTGLCWFPSCDEQCPPSDNKRLLPH